MKIIRLAMLCVCSILILTSCSSNTTSGSGDYNNTFSDAWGDVKGAFTDQKVGIFAGETARGLSIEQIETAINSAAIMDNWQIKKVHDGLIIARHYNGTSRVDVSVEYDLNGFTLKYFDSINMRYNAETGIIHRDYNTWTKQFCEDINTALTNMSNM